MREQIEEEKVLEKMKTRMIIDKIQDRRNASLATDEPLNENLDSSVIEQIVNEVDEELKESINKKLTQKIKDIHHKHRPTKRINESEAS